jgi:TolA-binding protein
MKKLSSISNQIKSNTFSYTGKGAFEAIVNKHSEQIKEWLENLVPLQHQIDQLDEMEHVEFQKRNYTRILTKIFPIEYKEFVSLNILVRDASKIAEYYQTDYNLTTIYNSLLEDKYLKYPGKYEKYVEFEIFQKFVMMYREDLISSLDGDIKETNSNVSKNMEEQKVEEIEEIAENLAEDNIVNQEESSIEDIENIPAEAAKSKETNWTNLLLGKLR